MTRQELKFQTKSGCCKMSKVNNFVWNLEMLENNKPCYQKHNTQQVTCVQRHLEPDKEVKLYRI